MNLLKSFFVASVFSSSIYLEHYGLGYLWLNSLIGIVAIYLILIQTRRELFWVGFFAGLLWFWWIFYSFEHYGVLYLSFVVIAVVGLIYGTIFFIVGVSRNTYIRAGLFSGLYFLSVLGFNWFKPQAIFANSYFDISFVAFAIILASLSLVIDRRNIAYLLLLVFALDFSQQKIPPPNMKIYMPQYHTAQEDKWRKSYRKTLINENKQNIEYAIDMGYDLVILPETTFPLALNKNEKLLNYLKDKSKDIAIITGGLELDERRHYNTSYFFHRQKLRIARKLVLVPFGEAVPLPAMMRDWINDEFYNGASDYKVAKHPTTFDIDGTKFRNAICYEATTDEIFADIDTSYMIVLSNNAWFVPSIEPVLQNILLRYYARKYDMLVYHSSNSSPNSVID